MTGSVDSATSSLALLRAEVKEVTARNPTGQEKKEAMTNERKNDKFEKAPEMKITKRTEQPEGSGRALDAREQGPA